MTIRIRMTSYGRNSEGRAHACILLSLSLAIPLSPDPFTISLSPAIPYFMANRKGLNGLQDLVRETHCRRAILT